MVKVDEERVSLKPTLQRSGGQCRRTEKPIATDQLVSSSGAQAELTQVGSEQLTRQTHKSLPTGQSVPGAGKKPATQVSVSTPKNTEEKGTDKKLIT